MDQDDPLHVLAQPTTDTSRPAVFNTTDVPIHFIKSPRGLLISCVPGLGTSLYTKEFNAAVFKVSRHTGQDSQISNVLYGLQGLIDASVAGLKVPIDYSVEGLQVHLDTSVTIQNSRNKIESLLRDRKLGDAVDWAQGEGDGLLTYYANLQNSGWTYGRTKIDIWPDSSWVTQLPPEVVPQELQGPATVCGSVNHIPQPIPPPNVRGLGSEEIPSTASSVTEQPSNTVTNMGPPNSVPTRLSRNLTNEQVPSSAPIFDSRYPERSAPTSTSSTEHETAWMSYMRWRGKDTLGQRTEEDYLRVLVG
jgi:hypothetical protein